MPDPDLAAEYFLLWQLAERMNQIFRDADLDICASCGTCPLCVARRRFAPRRPNIVLRTTILQH